VFYPVLPCPALKSALPCPSHQLHREDDMGLGIARPGLAYLDVEHRSSLGDDE
jgi:hypothetical protein